MTACVGHQATPAATPAGGGGGGAALGSWMLRVRLADFPALQQDGGIARVDSDSAIPVAVVRTGNTYTALSMICTHAGATIDVVPGGGGFKCPRHEATYAADGTWTGGHAAKHLKVLASAFDNASGVLTITA